MALMKLNFMKMKQLLTHLLVSILSFFDDAK